jgi:Ca2+-binding RTX toxin-like protein
MDTVYGGRGHDMISTGDDDDLIVAGRGNDIVNAGFDDDFIRGNQGNDTIYAGEGNDTVIAGSGDDVVYGGLDPSFPDELNVADDAGDPVPDNGDDLIFGNSGNDMLFGADDDDSIHGGTGDDYIEGGVDNDQLRGGKGDDVFGFNEGDGTDVIEDFGNGGDVIDLTSMGLTFDDIFLSQDESTAVIEAGDVTIRLENTDVDEVEEASFLL